MRILMDFSGDEKYCDVTEIEQTSLIEQGEFKEGKPNELFVDLYRIAQKAEWAISGQYILDGTMESYNKAIETYNNAVNKLLTTGYAKISDFGNVDWY